MFKLSSKEELGMTAEMEDDLPPSMMYYLERDFLEESSKISVEAKYLDEEVEELYNHLILLRNNPLYHFPDSGGSYICNNDAADDPPIYLRAMSEALDRGADYTWHVIKPGNATPQDTFLGNILPIEPKNQHQYGSATVSVGSRIYLIGGLEPKPPECISFTKSLDDVFYIDTTCEGQGGEWKKGPSLLRPVAMPFAVVLNKKTYIFDDTWDEKNGSSRDYLVLVSGPYMPEWDPEDNSFEAQVLGESDKDWHGINWEMPPDLTGGIICHVVDENKCFVYSSESKDLYVYNFASGGWALGYKNFGCYSKGSALVDGILYTMDTDRPGPMFAVDTTSVPLKKIPVKLNYTPDGVWWFPQLDSRGSSVDFFMVPLGNHRLAIMWYVIVHNYGELDKSMVIWCTKWEVSKADSVKGDFELRAVSRARYFSYATELVDCLPIVQSQKEEAVAEASNKGIGMKRKREL